MTAQNERGGRARTLEAALEVLEHEGEAALRFTDIAERAGVAITHPFASREGLVAALHEHRFAGLVADDQGALQRLTEAASDREQFASGIAAVTAGVITTGQANGLLDPTVDARALATFVQAYALGMIVADLDETPPPREAIAAVIERAIDAFLHGTKA